MAIQTTSENKKFNALLKKQNTPLTFASFMVTARLFHNITQAQAAKKLNFSKGSLCDIEKSRQMISPSLAKKIAKKLKCPEAVAIQASLQDQLNKTNIKYTVHLALLKV